MVDSSGIDVEKGQITETAEDGLGSDSAQRVLRLESSATAGRPRTDLPDGTKSSTSQGWRLIDTALTVG
jgi:hypothetical protein